jgi:pimeloyl-[acyl-carrier protein] synthase
MSYDYFDLSNDPHAVYAFMRQQGDVHWNDRYQIWIVVSHEAARTLLRDKRFSSDTTELMRATMFPVRSRDRFQPLVDFFRQWVLFSDPPYHTTFRQILNPYFSPEALVALRPKQQKHIHHLLSQCQGEWDFMAEFAALLPARIMADIIGLPYDDIPRILAWNQALSDFMEAVIRTPEINEKALIALQQQQAYFSDFKSELADQLPHESRWPILGMLLGAGIETNQNLMGNGLYRLLSHPMQWQQLLDDPKVLDSAVNECLRYDAPAQSIVRMAKEQVDFGGQVIRSGQYVRIMIGAINHDPVHYDRPEQFNINRTPNQRLAFGAGLHFCLGQALARQTTQQAFQILAEKLPHLKLVAQSQQWIGGVSLRGLKQLFVTS